MYTIKTERLGLRNWQPTDFNLYAEMNQDEEVMKYFPSLTSREKSIAQCKRFSDHFDKYGFTYFAVDLLSENKFIGFIGMMHQTYESPFTPFVDIGWRLQKSTWGNGYATEGAKACLEFAFNKMNLSEIYSVATMANLPSHNVMKKIGMKKIGEFDHPNIAADNPMRRCVCFRIKN